MNAECTNGRTPAQKRGREYILEDVMLRREYIRISPGPQMMKLLMQ